MADVAVPAKRKTDWLAVVVVWANVLFAGSASTFARSLDSWANLAAPVLFVGFHLALAWARGIRFGGRFFLVVLGFTLYFAASTFKYNAFHGRFFGIHFLTILCAYIALQTLRADYFRLVEKCMVALASIALGFWMVQIAAPGALYAILGNLSPFHSAVTGGGVNAVVYSMQPPGGGIPRNCGFAWEPGGFASLLVFAIYLNLARTRLRWKDNPGLWILGAALGSTQSTTGWTAAGFLLAWFVARQKMWYVWVLVAMPVVAAALAHPNMRSKIIETFNETEEIPIEVAVRNAYRWNLVYMPQRFTSFKICWADFKENPWLGFGGHNQDSWMGRAKIEAVIVTGIGEILRKFGLIGFVFFLGSTWVSARWWSNWCSDRWAGFSLVGIVLFVGFSYSQILLPFFMTFWATGVFLSKLGIQGRPA